MNRRSKTRMTRGFLTETFLILPLLLFGADAYAQSSCTTTNWSNAVGTALSAVTKVTDPAGPGAYENTCSLRIAASGNANYVEHVSPVSGGEARYIARFYLYPQVLTVPSNTSFKIFQGFNGSTEEFSVAYKNNGGAPSLVVTATGANPSSQTVALPTDTTAWKVIETDWTAGGPFKVWVNLEQSGTPLAQFAAAANAKITKVRLGTPSGGTGASVGGAMYVDSFVAHRSTPVGYKNVQCAGDANLDAKISVNDIIEWLDAYSEHRPESSPADFTPGSGTQVAVSDINVILDAYSGTPVPGFTACAQ